MSKLTSMTEAIARYVPDGSSVAISLALEQMIPFAAAHEIIRQQRRDLTLIGPISDILFDQLIGAGCVEKIVAAWAGNVSEGLGYCYRRSAEQSIPRAITIEEHTNFTIALALQAAAVGSPYIPTRSTLGSDLAKHNSTFRQQRSPLDGTPLLLIPAVRPDVTIMHVQRSDEDGNAHLWGNMGISEEAMLAAKDVILSVEEVVARKVILSDPNRVLGPSFKVRAVVHEPWGGHPSPIQGYSNRDHQYFHEYHEQTRTVESFQKWLEEWVLKVPNRAAYVKKLSEERIDKLGVREHRFAAAVDYGY
ncbi:MAG: CoA transferase subunit A [Ktedonobacteraceae bacterium]